MDMLLIFASMMLMYSLVYGPAKLVGNGSYMLHTLIIDLIFYGIGMRIFHTYTDMWNNNVVWGAGTIYPRDPDKMYIPGTTKQIVDKQREVFAEFFPRFKELFGMNVEDIDCFIPTQVAKWLIANGAKQYSEATGIDVSVLIDKTVAVIDKYGNVGASNIPIATYDAIESGMLKPGYKAFCMSVGVGISEGLMTFTY